MVSSLEYTAAGGGRVVIRIPIEPYAILGLQTNASWGEVKNAFRNKINQSSRQNRAMVSIANHAISSTTGRYERQSKYFHIAVLDQFILAAAGHTRELASLIDRRVEILQEVDEHNRTLLYLACKSGFYDMCKLLLEKGASVNKVQRDGSTPLHGAAYFGHKLVVALLLEHGAAITIRNSEGSTALEESATEDIKSLIQNSSNDCISSLAAQLREKGLMTHVRFVEYKGEVIGKELLRDPATLDLSTRAQWNNILQRWETVWHGTQFKHLPSIMEKGLIPAGSNGIEPPKGHFRLGMTYHGIDNWAAAIFVSPSILYSGHVAYSQRVLSQSSNWCVLVKALCKPKSYKSYDPTVFEYNPMQGEPDQPEYRVPVTTKDKYVILRVESARSVVVKSLVFVRLSFLEREDIDFEEALEVFSSA